MNSFRKTVCLGGVVVAGICPWLPSPQASASVTAMILAGAEFDSPADAPSLRLDTEGDFSFVGALEISNGSSAFRGSAVALSREWVLTAGHNADLNDDGLADAQWSGNLHLPGYGVFGVAQAYTHLGFSGFANPAINDDLALLRLAEPLPVGMGFPTLGSGAGIGDVITLVGFGRSGYGSYGYTTTASLDARRYGFNVIDSFTADDEGAGVFEVFRTAFDAPPPSASPAAAWAMRWRRSSAPGTPAERPCARCRTGAGSWWALTLSPKATAGGSATPAAACWWILIRSGFFRSPGFRSRVRRAC